MVTSNLPMLAALDTLLRDGYWDRTEIIRMADGSRRVRKQSKGQTSAGPWGEDNLRAEALYLEGLEAHLLDLFPRLIASWEDPAPGYDMAYLADHVDVAQLARATAFNQQQADEFQQHLGSRVFGQLHTKADPPCSGQASLAEHIIDTLAQAAQTINDSPNLVSLTQKKLIINGQECNNIAANIAALQAQTELLQRFDCQPQVRLHGDLFLENIVLPETSDDPHWPTQLVLIDPVSVAGVSAGHPLFDLAKYESYATGELPAMRRGHMWVQGMDAPVTEAITPLEFAIDWQHPEMQPLKAINWHGALRQSYCAHYGGIDEEMYALLQAYFAGAMVLCTSETEQQARALKAVLSLQCAVNSCVSQ